MKILFIADIHIKLGQKNVPKDWATERYLNLFSAIHEIDAELLILGGDILDKVPNMEELGLYFSFIRNIRIPTILFDGNHEASRKGHTFLTHLKDASKAINPLVDIVTEVSEYPWGTILPYCCLHTKNVFEELNKDNLLFTHVRGEIPPHVKPEIELDKFAEFPVVFAGDLHSHSNTQLNIVYPGSPVTTSFHREIVQTGYIILDSETFVWEWFEFDLPQLIRKTVSDPKEMVKTPFHHTIYELEGDLASLADVRNSDLLDKKVVKRSSEATLILDKRMTIEEELSEYLLYILELPETTVRDVIGTFSDNSK
jgi:DNA repair exonuclease SbcCD nuclease subunit